jgi:hypothetical protein
MIVGEGRGTTLEGKIKDYVSGVSSHITPHKRYGGITLLRGKSSPMEYKDSPDLKITDYFDIPHNSWSNEGVKAALNRAVGMCKNYKGGGAIISGTLS